MIQEKGLKKLVNDEDQTKDSDSSSKVEEISLYHQKLTEVEK